MEIVEPNKEEINSIPQIDDVPTPEDLGLGQKQSAEPTECNPVSFFPGAITKICMRGDHGETKIFLKQEHHPEYIELCVLGFVDAILLSKELEQTALVTELAERQKQAKKKR